MLVDDLRRVKIVPILDPVFVAFSYHPAARPLVAIHGSRIAIHGLVCRRRARMRSRARSWRWSRPRCRCRRRAGRRRGCSGSSGSGSRCRTSSCSSSWCCCRCSSRDYRSCWCGRRSGGWRYRRDRGWSRCRCCPAFRNSHRVQSPAGSRVTIVASHAPSERDVLARGSRRQVYYSSNEST